MAVRESDPARSLFDRLNPLSLLSRRLDKGVALGDRLNPDPPLDPQVRQLIEEYAALDAVFVRAEGEQLRRFLWDIPVIPIAVYQNLMVICVGYRDPISRGTSKVIRVRPELELFPNGPIEWLAKIGHSQSLKEEPWRLILDRRQRLGFTEIAAEVIRQPDFEPRPIREHLQRNLVEDLSLIQPFIEYAGQRKPSVRPRPDTVFRYLSRGLEAIGA